MLAVVVTALVLSSSGTAAEEFSRAVRLAAEDDAEQAARILVRLADDTPEHALADDALIKAAQLYEERLADPVTALKLYQRLIATYPDGRLARRAERRAELLSEGIGANGRYADVLGEYRSIMTSYGEGARQRAIERMERLVRDSPEFPLVADARYWLGSSYRHDGRLDEALKWFRSARAGSSRPQVVWRAKKAEADVLLSRGNFDESEALYRDLLGTGGGPDEHIIGSALERLAIERQRSSLAGWAWLAVIAFAAAAAGVLCWAHGSARAALRALVHPPTEVVFLLPIAGLWIAAALTSNTMVARAVIAIAVGGVAVTWASGAAVSALRARGRLGWAVTAAHVVATATAVLAICYIAVAHERLLDLIAETVTFGPER